MIRYLGDKKCAIKVKDTYKKLIRVSINDGNVR
jgi:hypothetical protein